MFYQKCCSCFGGNFNLQIWSHLAEQFTDISTTINSNPDKQ
jgi:hypothetical protein